jgi:hypothetical protein
MATGALLGIALAIVPVNFFVFLGTNGGTLFKILAVGQLAAGGGSLVCGVLGAMQRQAPSGRRLLSGILGFFGMLVGLGGPIGLMLAEVVKRIDVMGSAWGRPLRLRGRILHPRLRSGSDWTRGERPDTGGLDAPTRAALEALWLHDAQKEHASVPAFARISWLLAAVGAPAELVEAAHRAALEEIDHARRCFALAAAYGQRSHSVEPMPDLLFGGLDLRGDPLARLAAESLTDGCLLEDFNADVAGACERGCQEPTVKDVLARIAREERSHADFSWALLTWLLARGDNRVTRAVAKAATELAAVRRPTAMSASAGPLAEYADPASMRAHGRVPDFMWAQLWRDRLAETKRRVDALLASRPGRAEPSRPSSDIASLHLEA